MLLALLKQVAADGGNSVMGEIGCCSAETRVLAGAAAAESISAAAAAANAAEKEKEEARKTIAEGKGTTTLHFYTTLYCAAPDDIA